MLQPRRKRPTIDSTDMPQIRNASAEDKGLNVASAGGINSGAVTETDGGKDERDRLSTSVGDVDMVVSSSFDSNGGDSGGGDGDGDGDSDGGGGGDDTLPHKDRRIQHALSLTPFMEINAAERPPESIATAYRKGKEATLSKWQQPAAAASTDGTTQLAGVPALRMFSQVPASSTATSEAAMAANPAYGSESFL